jgi:hypothetical protein
MVSSFVILSAKNCSHLNNNQFCRRVEVNDNYELFIADLRRTKEQIKPQQPDEGKL